MKDTTLLGIVSFFEFFLGNYIFIFIRKFRRQVLFALKYPLTDELNFIRQFSVETPKNYQLWQHRQIIVEKLGISFIMEELDSIKAQISEDAKNIHCWQYRQWLVRKYNTTLQLEPELSYTEQLLSEDIFNNSVWNYRMFLIQAATSRHDNLFQEIEKTISLLDEYNQYNEAFWNYLSALINKSGIGAFNVIESISKRIGYPESTENYMYLKFITMIKGLPQSYPDIYHRLKKLHPINRPLWSALPNIRL